MKTDRELLELAGRAIGYSWDEKGYEGGGNWWNGKSWLCNDWNPLTDDGDALRLAVHLNITITPGDVMCAASAPGAETHQAEFVNVDVCAATRRAIVRAAAAIGEQTK